MEGEGEAMVEAQDQPGTKGSDLSGTKRRAASASAERSRMGK